MLKIDAYTHFGPPKFLSYAEKLDGKPYRMGHMFGGMPTLNDPKARLDLLDQNEVDVHLLVASPFIEGFPALAADRKKAPELARVMNDEMAAVVAAYPTRFRAVGVIPSCDPDAMVKELHRAVRDLGFAGVAIPVGPTMKRTDHPDYEALYRMLTELDATLWLHPSRPPMMADYNDETHSQFMEWLAVGWLHDTTSAMFRIVFSGVFDRYPGIRIVTHHHGALLPYHGHRFESVWALFEKLGSGLPTKISKPYLDHFRNFYVDTAVLGFAPKVIELAVDFFGADHVLFGSDTPLDDTGGTYFTSETIRSIEAMNVSAAAKQAIFGGNAARIARHEPVAAR